VTFTDNKIDTVLEVDKITGALRIIDDSEDDYLYSPTEPRLLDAQYQGGKFEIVEDDEKGSLAKAIYGITPQIAKKKPVNIAVAGK